MYRGRAPGSRSISRSVSGFASVGPFCDPCKEAISKLGASHERRLPPQRLSSREGCKLCQLFARLIKPFHKHSSSPNPDQYVAVWSCFGGIGLEFKAQRSRTHAIRGGSSGWLISNRIHANIDHHLHARIVDKDKIDWEVVKGWLLHCRVKHSTSCGRKQPLAVPNLQVIDCFSRKIVQLSESLDFAALSYCWGRSKESPLFSSRLPAYTSHVIEDAIVVTRKLGLTYLWVDRYCIDQSDPSTKHALIQRMDQIYNNAAITIIDAAGHTPGNGLPGVTKKGRRPQESVYYRGQKLISIPNMPHVVASSKWGSRGWTYQEGLLSRRRLVFTETQVYFQCLEQHFCESLVWPMENVSRTYQPEAKALMQHTQAFPPQGVGTLQKHIYKRIQEYLRRSLSHDSDILYAFTGILHHFLRREEPIYHIWGVPFKVYSAIGKESVEDNFLSALLWLPSSDWKSRRLSRRAEFPSWSWTGWRGIAGIEPGHEVAKTCNVVKNVTVNIRREEDELVSVADYVAQLQADDYNLYRYSTSLHVVGWVTYVRLIQYLQLSRSNSDLSDRKPTSTVDVLDESARHKLCQATIMTHYSDGRPIPSPEHLYRKMWPVLLYFGHSGVMHGIILREIDGIVYEKLGVLPYLKVDPQPDFPFRDSDHHYLLKRDYGPPHKPLKLYCERKSIIFN